MRLPNEQSGSTSLFAHPAAVAPSPLEPQEGATRQVMPEDRLREALTTLEQEYRPAAKQELCDHQALLARWYFRPQVKREGELVLIPREHGELPLKSLLRACARVYRAALEKMEKTGEVNGSPPVH